MTDTMAESRKDPEYLSTLERGLAVLRCFSADRPEMTLSEVALAAGLSPAVARRCLNTLALLGYVARDGRRFLLRPKVLEFSDAFMTAANIEQVVTPFLQHLRDESGDSASMAVRSGDEVMYIAHVSTMRAIRLSAHAGTRFPIHATSLGKAILAFSGEEEIADYLDQATLTAFTANTISSGFTLRETLSQVLQDGYASAIDELDHGIRSLAVPIFDREKKVIAAINCSTATGRATGDDFVAKRVALLREAAGQIERSLQRSPTLLRALVG